MHLHVRDSLLKAVLRINTPEGALTAQETERIRGPIATSSPEHCTKRVHRVKLIPYWPRVTPETRGMPTRRRSNRPDVGRHRRILPAVPAASTSLSLLSETIRSLQTILLAGHLVLSNDVGFDRDGVHDSVQHWRRDLDSVPKLRESLLRRLRVDLRSIRYGLVPRTNLLGNSEEPPKIDIAFQFEPKLIEFNTHGGGGRHIVDTQAQAESGE